jgi:dihydrofolate synthase/folylpolyglutamate synthase
VTYDETIRYLQQLEVTSGWDLKLDRMRAAVALRGHPERRVRTIHVAGTNGKGSTAATLEAVLRAAGVRTGLYTSPHLVDFAERIRAGGRTIPHDAVVALVEEQRAALTAAGLALTHFEFTTLLAFEWMARVGVEIAVVEVGLGGRLDATNVIDPMVGVITSIGLDHEAFLGTTLGAIAREKAGIAKAAVPLVVGPVGDQAWAAIAAHAREVGAPLVSSPHVSALDVGADGALVFHGPNDIVWPDLRLACRGGFQHANLQTALTALTQLPLGLGIDAAVVRRGLASVEWPGRLDVVDGRPPIVIDGAHNPDGVEALAADLPAIVAGRPVTAVFAVMGDKDWRGMLARLAPQLVRVIATRVGPRSLDPRAVGQHLDGALECDVVEDPRLAVRSACRVAGESGVVLVVGSLFLAGEAYAELRSAPLFPPWQGWERIGTQGRP